MRMSRLEGSSMPFAARMTDCVAFWRACVYAASSAPVPAPSWMNDVVATESATERELNSSWEA